MRTSNTPNKKNVPQLPVVMACIVTENNNKAERCIESLSKQDYPALNYSTLDKNDAPIGKVKNQLIHNAQDYHFFAIIDPTTELLPNYISNTVIKLLEYPDEIGAVYSDYWISKDYNCPIYCPPYNRDLLDKNPDMIGPNIVVNKLAIQKFGGFNNSLMIYENYDLLLRLSEGLMITHIPELLYIKYENSHTTNQR